MKYFTVALLVALAFVATARRTSVDDCKDEIKISNPAIENIQSPDPPEYFDVQGFPLCFGKKEGLFNEEGELQTEKIKKVLKNPYPDEQLFQNVYNKCVVKKDTPDDTAEYLIKCLYNGGKEYTTSSFN